jgi:hypothetical protein
LEFVAPKGISNVLKPKLRPPTTPRLLIHIYQHFLKLVRSFDGEAASLDRLTALIVRTATFSAITILVLVRALDMHTTSAVIPPLAVSTAASPIAWEADAMNEGARAKAATTAVAELFYS